MRLEHRNIEKRGFDMLNVDKVKELMKEKGIKSYKQLAKLTSIPYTTLYYMLSGHDMFVSSLVTLSNFFNVPMDYLIEHYYGVMSYTNEKEIFVPTSSLIEAAVITMM